MIQQVLSIMKDITLCRKIVTDAKKKYNIKSYEIDRMNSKVAAQIIQKSQNILEEGNTSKARLGSSNYKCVQEKWFKKELRTFVWLLVGLAYALKKQISQITQNQFQIFQNIFSDKSKQFLYYKSRLILPLRNIKWQQNEIQLLQTIISQKKQSIKQWNRISLDLYFSSGKNYVKPPQKCRELWFNHLNPQVDKTQWKIQQDLELVQLAIENGLRWSLLAQKLSSKRTEHMTKNRFLSLLKVHNVDKNRMHSVRLLKVLKKNIQKQIQKEPKSECQKQPLIHLESENIVKQTTQEEYDLGSIVSSNNYDFIEEKTLDMQLQAVIEPEVNLLGIQKEQEKRLQDQVQQIFQIDISQYLNIY